ncbi:flagellar hook-basal body protein [Mediterraneibacter sp. NSJ-55]|uniref:Flagellar hook-basal body protein n=1 Tax=Mediterraneibacter hominis TaxID=2763054 RepID=A0A923RSI4_9FIRM|nr:flagellar hook-basal body protein [Mediterraneibacter hominis]MBC5689357.1 flagellar hook-basal body protein [Mediterraneibacter hominis]
MDTSFYTAVRGARTQQTHLDIIANNIANVNTTGYKTKRAGFLDLMYYNMHAPETTDTRLQAGTGVLTERTDTDFTTGGIIQTGGRFDYAISGYGFFMIQDPLDNSLTYTRSGSFALSQRQDGLYLTDAQGRLVLDAQRNPIRYIDGELTAVPGIFDFVHTNGMLSVGENGFTPVAKNGAAVAAADAELLQGTLENSNVDLAEELAKVIESSRAYSYMLKMVQTSDEVEQTINGLRG